MDGVSQVLPISRAGAQRRIKNYSVANRVTQKDLTAACTPCMSCAAASALQMEAAHQSNAGFSLVKARNKRIKSPQAQLISRNSHDRNGRAQKREMP
jgi:hypothetical protein